jgi:Arc/MetJ-type ribon-helix-helix transcriptional regulator
MKIDLSGQRERIVLSLVQAGRFASADDVIDEALRLVEQHNPGPEGAPGAERTGRQLENLRRLGHKLDAMPPAADTDEQSNRDHDRILYGQ